MGFDHHPLLPALPSVMLYFYGKAGEARILSIIVWRCGQCEKEALCHFKPSPWTTFWLIRYLCISCPSMWEVANHFSLGPFIFYVLFLRQVCLFLSCLSIPQVFVLFKMTGSKFCCLFQFGKHCNVFYWLYYCFVIYSREEFFMSVQKKPSCNCGL